MGKGREKRKKNQIVKTGKKKRVARKHREVAMMTHDKPAQQTAQNVQTASAAAVPPDLIFKVDAQGDTLFIKAPTEEAARATLRQHMGDIPNQLLTFTVVDALPEGESFL